MSQSEHIEHRPAIGLTVHPAIAGLPGISSPDHARLATLITITGKVREPLICDGLRVIDGRARLSIAQAGNLVVPTIQRPMSEGDVLQYAIDARVGRGQMTRLGIALLLFEHHPLLAATRQQRKTVGLKRGISRGGSSATESDDASSEGGSYRSLAAQYHIDRDHFTLLCKARDACRKGSDDWAQVRRWVWEEECGPTRLLGNLEGYKAGRTVEGGGARDAANPYHIIRRSFVGLANQFEPEAWGQLDAGERTELRALWLDVLAKLPTELRA